MNWFSRIFGKRPDTEPASPEKPALITSGILQTPMGLVLCSVETPIRGVKIVTVPKEFYARYIAAEKEWDAVQGELAALPKTLRPRRRSTRKARVQTTTESE
jgi:hypothetical protein